MTTPTPDPTVPGGPGYVWAYGQQDPIQVRVGFTTPSLELTVLDRDGCAVDLSGAAVVAVLADYSGAELRRAPAQVYPDQVGHPGWVSYAWQAADVAVPGNFGLLLAVTDSQGETSYFPTDGLLPVTVANTAASPYLVQPEEVARYIGLPKVPCTNGGEACYDDDSIEVIGDMVLDAQADVEQFLNRPIVATLFTEVVPLDPTEPFGLRLSYDPVGAIASQQIVPDTPWMARVSYVAGISDRIALRAITRFVKAHAAETYLDHPVYGKALRAPYSQSSDGESISYGVRRSTTLAGGSSTVAGSPPALESLRTWMRHGVFSRRRLLGGGSEGLLVLNGLAGAQTMPSNADGTVDDGWVRNPATGEVSP